MPLVDIVLRTKDRPLFLARSLDDILAQEFTDWQLIVVNDGGDLAPVQEALAARPGLAGRLTVVDLPESTGRGAAVNPGVKAGDSPLVTWHDDDDTWHPKFLSCTIAHLETTDDVAVAVRTEIVYERRVGDRLLETGREIFPKGMLETTYFDLLRFNHVVPISVLYRRKVHDRVGYTDPRLRSVMDWDFNLRLWLADEVGFIPDVLAYWHQRPDARGVDGNSVIAEPQSHVLHDRLVRNEALRAYVQVHGSGDLLYLAKYVDERMQEIHTRLDRVQERYKAIGRLLQD